MILQNTPKRLFLFIADFIVLYTSLIFAISFRNWSFGAHVYQIDPFFPSFIFIFATTLIIYYIYGLYDKPTLRLVRELSSRVATSQALSGFAAVVLFYSLPGLGIAPKTILFIYLVTATIAMMIWRYIAFKVVLRYRKQHSVIIGSGRSFHKLVHELTINPHTGVTILAVIDLDNYEPHKVKSVLESTKPDSIIMDIRDERIKTLFSTMYDEMFRGTTILDIINVYEDVFDMEPIDLLDQEWMFYHIKSKRRIGFVKRFIDLLFAVPAFIVSFIFYPFVCLAIKLEDRGPIFYDAVRIGQYGEIIHIYKFRTMENKPTNEVNETKKISRIGSFLRKTRIDELPQLWNVIRGDVSLIGPRPEAPSLVNEYQKSIPFYQVRHLTRPGLSGWAQIQQKEAPKFGVNVNQTETKLAYDLYYIKYNTLLLDISVILKTFKVLLSKSGV